MALVSETPLEWSPGFTIHLCPTWPGDSAPLNLSLTHFNGVSTYLVELLWPLSKIKHIKCLAYSRYSISAYCPPPNQPQPHTFINEWTFIDYLLHASLGHWVTRVLITDHLFLRTQQPPVWNLSFHAPHLLRSLSFSSKLHLSHTVSLPFYPQSLSLWELSLIPFALSPQDFQVPRPWWCLE